MNSLEYNNTYNERCNSNFDSRSTIENINSDFISQNNLNNYNYFNAQPYVTLDYNNYLNNDITQYKNCINGNNCNNNYYDLNRNNLDNKTLLNNKVNENLISDYILNKSIYNHNYNMNQNYDINFNKCRENMHSFNNRYSRNVYSLRYSPINKQPNVQVRTGDWICTCCANLNFQRRLFCHACKQSKFFQQ